jgi:hypothetical protein
MKNAVCWSDFLCGLLYGLCVGSLLCLFVLSHYEKKEDRLRGDIQTFKTLWIDAESKLIQHEGESREQEK